MNVNILLICLRRLIDNVCFKSLAMFASSACCYIESFWHAAGHWKCRWYVWFSPVLCQTFN